MTNEHIKLIKQCEEQNKIDTILTVFEFCSSEQIIFFKNKIKEFKNVYVKDIPKKEDKDLLIKCFNNNKISFLIKNLYCSITEAYRCILLLFQCKTPK